MNKQKLNIIVILAFFILLIVWISLLFLVLCGCFEYAVGCTSWNGGSAAISTLLQHRANAIVENGQVLLRQNGYQNSTPQIMLQMLSASPAVLLFCIPPFLILILCGLYVWHLHIQNAVQHYVRAVLYGQTDYRAASRRCPSWQGLLGDLAREQQRRQASEDKLIQEKQHLNEYIQNVYHQLKTPISAVEVNLRLLEEQMNHSSKYLCDAIALSAKSNRLLHALLRTEQFDAHVIHLTFAPCNLLCIVEDTCAELSAQSPVPVQLQINEDYEQFDQALNAFWLTEALLSLIRNAQEYTSADHGVTVSVIHESQRNIIRIVNPCADDIATPDPTCRFRSLEKDHFGIGLHLADRIVKAHFGTLHMQTQDRTMEAVLSLPYLNGSAAYGNASGFSAVPD